MKILAPLVAGGVFLLGCDPVEQNPKPKETKTYHTAGELCGKQNEGEESSDTRGRTLICKLHVGDDSLNGLYIWEIK